MTRKKSYTLSLEADRDIDAIFDYTEQEYDFDQAVKYLGGFEVLFEKLLENPKLGKKRDGLKKGLRSIPKAEHVVFYRILADSIRIVRVLHSNRDIPSLLD